MDRRDRETATRLGGAAAEGEATTTRAAAATTRAFARGDGAAAARPRRPEQLRERMERRLHGRARGGASMHPGP